LGVVRSEAAKKQVKVWRHGKITVKVGCLVVCTGSVNLHHTAFTCDL